MLLLLALVAEGFLTGAQEMVVLARAMLAASAMC